MRFRSRALLEACALQFRNGRTNSNSALMAFGAAALVVTASAQAKSTTADMVMVNGTIITMESPEAQAKAVAIRDGHIMRVGDTAAILKLKGRTTKVIDLKGKTVLPGFIDAHGHLSGVAGTAGLAQLGAPPLGSVTDIPSLQAVLKAYIAQHNIPAGQPVIGVGYDDSQMAEARQPNRHDLDKVSTDHPILISHISGHLGVMNTAALEKAGLLKGATNPPGGVIQREADGTTATGVLEENAFFRAGLALGQPSMDAQLAQLDQAQKIYAQNGITTAQDGRLFPPQLSVLEEAAKRGRLYLDVAALLAFEVPWKPFPAAQMNQPYDHHLRLAGVKLSLDGSPQGRTAWLHDPVPVPPKGAEPGYRGYPQLSDDVLRAKIAEAADKGWQVFAHVNGDQAMQQLIDAVAAVNQTRKTPVARTIAIHSQVVTRAQLEQMKALDIQPSFFVSHTYYWGDWHREVALGPVRADRISPQREAIDLGLVPTSHNDAPVVPPDIMRLIWSSVTRLTRSNDILGPAQRITPYEALQLVTSNAAWQIHEDNQKGTITAGKRADLVVLDANPLTASHEKIYNIKVLETIKDGRHIFGGP